MIKPLYKISQLSRARQFDKPKPRIVVQSPEVYAPKRYDMPPPSDKVDEVVQALRYGVTHDNYIGVLQQISDMLHDGTLPTVVPLLPLIFNLNKAPYTLDNHFQFEPLFSGRLPANMVWVTGRQVGKCNSNSVCVYCEDGRQITIEELVKNRIDTKILSYDEANDTFVPCRILNHWETGSKDCVEVLTKTGRTITSTLDHKYLTVDGWKRLGDISVGSSIAVPKKLDFFGNSDVTLDEAACMAYLTADGSITRDMLWTKADTRLVEDFSAVCNRFNWKLTLADAQRYLYYIKSPRSNDGTCNHEAKILCQKFGIYGKRSKEKAVPDLILTAPKNVIARFLQVLISSDGSFYKKGKANRVIEYSSASKELAYQVHSLLTRFGIVSKIRYVSKKCGENYYDTWIVYIASEPNINLFLQEIGWLRDIPKAPIHEQDKSVLDVIPVEVLKKLYQELKEALPEKDSHGRAKGLYDYFGSASICGLRKCINSNTPIRRQKLLNLQQHPIIDKYLNSNILWDEVVSVTDAGKKKTYDLEIDTHHNYVANNIITHNSMNNAAHSGIFAQLIPGLKILHLTPLFSQIHRFSVNYVKPFIEYSPIKGALVDPSCTDAINQRNLRNGSVLYFTFAFKDLLRTRGYDSWWNKYDEAQDFDPDFIPIIDQTTSGAPGNMKMLFKTGTPKTLDNNLQKSLDRSSWAEWHIKCPHCGHWNVPALDGDLDAMIGPRTPQYIISKERPGIVCAGMSLTSSKQRCGKPLNVREGRWVHRYRERKWEHAGFHIPQIILPQHCEHDHSWRDMLAHREGADNMTQAQFYNEICGCSYDVGARLITLTELRKACTLPTETTKLRDAANYVKRQMEDGAYYDVVLAIDWGGGGVKEISFTVVAVVALRYDGSIDVPFGYRSLTPHLHQKESANIIYLRNLFNASHIVHDGCGNGPSRETQLTMYGVPREACVRINYSRIGNGALMKYRPPNVRSGEPGHWNLDKARSLSWLCEYIKHNYIHFFQYDTHDGAKPGLIDDFLSLMEDKTRTELGADIYSIVRDKTRDEPDDFTAAVNYGCQYFWGAVMRRYPEWSSISINAHMGEISEELINEIEKYDSFEIDRLAGMSDFRE